MSVALGKARQALIAHEFPVGCVLVHENKIVATGQRLNSSTDANELDHAEIVALRSLLSSHPAINRSQITLYSTMEPCLMCFSALLLNNIHTIVYGYEDVMGGGTNLPLAQLNPLYQKMQVKVIPHILRKDSLQLFKAFFKNQANDYWRHSLLAEYTLNQDDS